MAMACTVGHAHGQELVQEFTNPSFGGNPFYSDHLMATATAQRPERPSTGGANGPLTEAELFARQIQSRLLSALSTGLVEAITGADPDHSVGETRWITFGLSNRWRLLAIAHTDEDDIIHLISARAATRPERRLYEEG